MRVPFIVRFIDLTDQFEPDWVYRWSVLAHDKEDATSQFFQFYDSVEVLEVIEELTLNKREAAEMTDFIELNTQHDAHVWDRQRYLDDEEDAFADFMAEQAYEAEHRHDDERDGPNSSAWWH